MISDKTVAVVVPAYNEERQILHVLETMPDFVDRIVVVNDASTDGTAAVVLECLQRRGTAETRPLRAGDRPSPSKFNEADCVAHAIREQEERLFVPAQVANQHPETDRIILINHQSNGGVGAAIARGYRWCLDRGIDCTAVMAGDGQMDPTELASICRPVVEDGIDYVKGNRLLHRSAWLVVPRIRYIGNAILSILTKIASGYWHVSDTQSGYTAISRRALQAIRIHEIYRGYGMPNDLLVKLNIAFCTLKEVGIKPVYRVGEASKMNVAAVIPRIAWLLFRCFFQRLWVKYLFRDFHPLFLLYHLAFGLGILAIPYGVKILRYSWAGVNVSPVTVLAFIFLAISAFQSLLFAMWMDIQDNERLYKS